MLGELGPAVAVIFKTKTRDLSSFFSSPFSKRHRGSTFQQIAHMFAFIHNGMIMPAIERLYHQSTVLQNH